MDFTMSLDSPPFSCFLSSFPSVSFLNLRLPWSSSGGLYHLLYSVHSQHVLAADTDSHFIFMHACAMYPGTHLPLNAHLVAMYPDRAPSIFLAILAHLKTTTTTNLRREFWCCPMEKWGAIVCYRWMKNKASASLNTISSMEPNHIHSTKKWRCTHTHTHTHTHTRARARLYPRTTA